MASEAALQREPRRSPRHSRSGYAAVALAATLWGTWSLFFRPAERIAPVAPAVQSVVVFGVVFAVMAPLAWRDRRGTSRPRRVWLLIVGLGAVDALNVLFFFMAMQRTSLAVAVLTHYLALPLVAIAAPLVLGERTTRSAGLAFAAALAGLVLLVEPWRAASAASLVGAAFGSASAVFFAINVLLSKLAGGFVSPRELLAWRLPSAIGVLLLFVPEGGFALPWAVYCLLGAAASIGGVTAGWLYYWGLSRVEASRATVLSLMEPTMAVLIGLVVWREVPGPAAAVGAVLILVALYVATRAPRAASPSPPIESSGTG